MGSKKDKVDEQEVSSSLKFKFKFSEDYNPVYVNGAFGGVTPNGELVLNFYLERHAIPKSQTMALESGGTLGEEIEREPVDYKASMVRYVTHGVVLSPPGAARIYSFIGQHLKTMGIEVQEVPNENTDVGCTDDSGLGNTH